MPPKPLTNAASFSFVPWIFLFTLAVRLVVLIRFSHSIHFLPEGDDMAFYNDWALRIAHGPWTDGKAFYGLPGYAYCVAGIYQCAGGYNPFAVGLLQAVFDGVVAVLLYKIALFAFCLKDLGKVDRLAKVRPHAIGLMAAAAWIFYLPAQAFSAILMPTVWLVLAYYALLWWVLKTRSASWYHPWLGIGIAAGAVAMLVATILFLLPLIIVAIAIKGEPAGAWRIRLTKIAGGIAVLVAGVYIGASPAWVHNYFVAHERVMLSAHSGINFWIGNNPAATGYPKMPPGIHATQDGLLRDSITLAENAAGRSLTRAEVSTFWSGKANSYIRDHFAAWLHLIAAKLGNFWNAYQYDDLSVIKLLRDEGILPPGLRFGIIAALGLAALIPVVRAFPRAGWVAAAVLLHMCALLPVFVTERYRLAAVPGLMILGAGGLWLLWENLTRSRWVAVGGQVAALVVVVWFVSIPRADIGLWSLDHYKAGIRATAAGDLDRAQRNLETAFAYVQDNSDINFALGNLWLARAGRTTDGREMVIRRTHAKLFYRRALEIEPGHAGTLNNLGVLAMDEKRWAVAERFLAAAVQAEPESGKTHYLLARTRFENGDMAGARASLDEAMRLRPGQREIVEFRDQLTKPSTP